MFTVSSIRARFSKGSLSTVKLYYYLVLSSDMRGGVYVARQGSAGSSAHAQKPDRTRASRLVQRVAGGQAAAAACPPPTAAFTPILRLTD